MFGVCHIDVSQLATFPKTSFSLQVDGEESKLFGVAPAIQTYCHQVVGSIACLVQTITRLLSEWC